MAESFRNVRPFLAPRWLTEGEGGLVGYALDLVKDAFAERVRLGLLARLPQNDPTGATTAPPDALAAMGRDRRVVRARSETDQQYAARLLRWIDDRKTAGSAFTLLRKLSEYLGPLPSFRVVDDSGNWYSRAANGAESYELEKLNWNWDHPEYSGRTGWAESSAGPWARFWVIIYPNGLWTQSTEWGGTGTEWGAGSGSWGSSATAEEVQLVRAIVADWKPANTYCHTIIVAFDPDSFNPAAPEPDGYWRTWSKVVGGVRVPSRLTTAIYWDGV